MLPNRSPAASPFAGAPWGSASERTPDERDEANWARSLDSVSPFWRREKIDAATCTIDYSTDRPPPPPPPPRRGRDSLSPINQRHGGEDQADRLPFRLDVATPTIPIDGAFRSSGTAPASTLFSRSSKRTATQTPKTPRTPRTTPRRKRDDSVIIALVHGRGFARQDVGLAAVNLTSCELRLSQMNDSQTYTKTLAKLNLYRPVEILMPDTIVCAEPVSPLVKRINEFDSEIAITALERAAFNESKGIDCVTELSVTDASILHVVLEQKFYALAAAAALVHHLERNANVSFAPRTLRISYQGTDRTVLIDSETALRLELVCSLDETGNGPSLLSSIDHCRTSAGTRMLRSNLLEPFADAEAIESRLDAVEELVERPAELYQPIKESLSRFVDVERAIRQCVVVPRRKHDKELSAEFIEQRINAVIGLRHVLTLVRPLRAVLEQANSPLIAQLASELADNPVADRVLERINRVLEDKAKPTKGKIGMKRQRLNAIKTGADLMLDVCRQTYNQLESELEDYVAELVVKHEMPLTLAHTANRGYHLQQTIPRPKKRDNNPTGRLLPPPIPTLPAVFICIKRQGNCLAFTTQHLLVANERLKSVQKDAEQLTDTIIEQLLAEIRQDVASLYKLREIVCQLDVLASFACCALSGTRRPKSSAYDDDADDEPGGYCRPKFDAHATLVRSGRHPILNQRNPETLVSNDTDMNEQHHFHVITGAHMSGKSTYIRQVMLLQILAQIGSFVPAKSATFRLVDQMFSRLGTQDRFGNNASSFSLEMMEMNYIVRNAGPRSLVILDELCQNTSRQEGSALCWSLCEDLLELGAWVLITTHTPFITRLGDIYGPVVNYHMQVVETASNSGRPSMHFTHKILPGTCQLEHYGLKLAKMVAFPDELVRRAEELLPLFDSRMKLTLPRVPLECSLNKLNYDLYCRVKDLDARMDSLPDDIAKIELDRVLKSYTEELSRIIAQHEVDSSPVTSRLS